MRKQLLRTIGAGIAGALAVTLINEGMRRVSLKAPRLNILGERVVKRACRMIGVSPPRGRNLYGAALAGDLLANSAYYTLVGAGHPRHPWMRGLLLGSAAGLGMVAAPPKLGLGRLPRGITRDTKAMTVAWYLAGGLAAAAAQRALEQRATA